LNFSDLLTYLNKIKTFYLPDKASYWNTITPCSIIEKPESLSNYYLDFSSKANYPNKFTNDGIPLYSFKGQSFIEHPIVIAQYALGIYELLIKNKFEDELEKNKFIYLANWFENNSVTLKHGKGWLIHIKYPEYDLLSPWISAMAQGEAISVLTRAAKLSNNRNYEQLAIDALLSFKYDVKEGGLVNYFNSIPIYEEFPTPKKTMAVLNGFIFALFGLFDLYLLNKNKIAESLYNTGIDSLKKILPYFDVKNWTRYYLFDYPNEYYSSFTYHILVVEQLKAMYYLSNDKFFLNYSNKWIEYSKSYYKKTYALYKKLTYANKVLSK
jgi:hypothetical protein